MNTDRPTAWAAISRGLSVQCAAVLGTIVSAHIMSREDYLAADTEWAGESGGHNEGS
jgi:hypothetical protein